MSDSLLNYVDHTLAKLVPGLDKDTLFHYLAIAINTHSSLVFTDPDGKILYANKHFCSAFARTPDELIGKQNGIQLLLGDLDEKTLSALWKKIRSGETWTGTVANNATGNNPLWGEGTIIPLRDTAKTIRGHICLRTDTTRLKRAEAESTRLAMRYAAQAAELRETQNQFKVFFDNAPVGLSWREVLPDGTYGKNYANPRFCEISGLTVEQLRTYENVRQVSTPEDWTRQMELQKEVDDGKTSGFTLQKRYLHPGGKTVWVNLTVVVLRDAARKITHHFAMVEDITARHAAELELRGSEARWRTYLKTATDTLYTIAPDGTYKFISASVTRHLGYEPDELTGVHFLDIIHPDDRPNCEEYVRRIMAGELHPGATIEYRIRHKNGEYIWHASAAAAYADRNNQQAFLGIDRDISIRKKAQDELKIALTQREELERIINRSQSVVILWKIEPGIPVEYVSKSIRQFGYEPAHFTERRRNYIDIIHPDDRTRILDEIAAHAAKSDRDYIQEYRITCNNGAIRWVEDHTVVRRDHDGNISHHEGLITDITDRKEAEERARKMQERALAQAAEVQRHLSPHAFPDTAEIETSAFSQPSAHIGGDYYDIFRAGETRWAFLIADVAGKGPAAALMMAACRASLRFAATGEDSPAAIVKKVNRFLHPDMPHGMFISLFLGILDTKTHRLRYIRAGHEPAVILRAGATDAELLTADGLAIGFDEGDVFDSIITEQEIPLNPGDLLALYTDGITEAANATGEEFGRDRFIGTLSRHGEFPLEKTVENIAKHLAQYSTLATRTDDRTLLLIRPRQPAAPSV